MSSPAAPAPSAVPSPTPAAPPPWPDPDEHSPLPREYWPDVSHLVTEDDTPVDNIFSEKQQRLLTQALQEGWRGGPESRAFITTANVGLYFALHQTPLVPDFLLSLDVSLPDDLWPKENRSYLTWMFGKPPDLVVEIVSNRVGREDDEKLRLYARGGVGHYVIYDPDAHLSERPLRSYRAVGHHFEETSEPLVLPGTDLTLRPWTGRYENALATWLRWHDVNTGALIPTGGELAVQERQRADEQRQHAEEQRQRAERLAERLRTLGIDPEQV